MKQVLSTQFSQLALTRATESIYSELSLVASKHLLVSGINKTLEALEGVTEFFEDFRRTEAVPCSVVRRVDRIHDHEHRLHHCGNRVEGPANSINLALSYI